MKVIPVGGAAPSVPQGPTPAQAARERAISRLTQQPVPNATQIAPEELSAVKPPEAEEELEAAPELSQDGISETPAPAAVEEPAKDPLADKYLLLARKEKAMRMKAQQQDQALKAREDALKAREAQLAAKDQEYQQGYIARDRFKSSPLEVLSEAGISYEDLTQQLLTQQPTDPRVQATITELKAEIQALKQANEKSVQTYQDQQQEQYKAAVRQIETDVKALVQDDPEFEIIRNTGSHKDVVDLIKQTFDEDGTLLSVEEAAKLVEDELTERLYKVTSTTEKLKKRLAPQPTPKVAPQGQATDPKTQAAPKQPQMKTLTNTNSSSRQLSARERAILAFKGQQT